LQEWLESGLTRLAAERSIQPVKTARNCKPSFVPVLKTVGRFNLSDAQPNFFNSLGHFLNETLGIVSL
jgi:hypothetical protein